MGKKHASQYVNFGWLLLHMFNCKCMKKNQNTIFFSKENRKIEMACQLKE